MIILNSHSNHLIVLSSIPPEKIFNEQPYYADNFRVDFNQWMSKFEEGHWLKNDCVTS